MKVAVHAIIMRFKSIYLHLRTDIYLPENLWLVFLWLSFRHFNLQQQRWKLWKFSFFSVFESKVYA